LHTVLEAGASLDASSRGLVGPPAALVERAPVTTRSANIIAVETIGTIILRVVLVFLVCAIMSADFDLVFCVSISISFLFCHLLRQSFRRLIAAI
jgi:hypothetical protein